MQKNLALPLPGTEQVIPADMALITAGFIGVEPSISDAFQLDLTNRNTVATQPQHYQTSQDKVFCCGDMHRGASLVVWAIAEGRACAKEVDQYLMDYTNMIP